MRPPLARAGGAGRGRRPVSGSRRATSRSPRVPSPRPGGGDHVTTGSPPRAYRRALPAALSTIGTAPPDGGGSVPPPGAGPTATRAPRNTIRMTVRRARRRIESCRRGTCHGASPAQRANERCCGPDSLARRRRPRAARERWRRRIAPPTGSRDPSRRERRGSDRTSPRNGADLCSPSPRTRLRE